MSGATASVPASPPIVRRRLSRTVSRCKRHTVALAVVLSVLTGCHLGGEGPVSKALLTSRRLSQQGQLALEKHDLAKAESLLNQAVRTCPDDVEARRQHAESLWAMGHRQAAADQLERAMRQCSADPLAHARLAQLRLEMGQIEPALQQADRALDLDPQAGVAWTVRARAKRQSGKLESALADYQRALSLSPGDRGLLLEISELYRELDRPARALATLHALADTYPPGEEPQNVLYLAGLAQAALGRFDEAAQSMTAARDRGPPTPEILTCLGEYELRSGREDRARKAVQQALAIDPHDSAGIALSRQLELAAHRATRAN